MQQSVLELDGSTESQDDLFDDLEMELRFSAREASFMLVPFANLDFTDLKGNDRAGLERTRRPKREER